MRPKEQSRWSVRFGLKPSTGSTSSAGGAATSRNSVKNEGSDAWVLITH
jgi:hypothetical protein